MSRITVLGARILIRQGPYAITHSLEVSLTCTQPYWRFRELLSMLQGGQRAVLGGSQILHFGGKPLIHPGPHPLKKVNSVLRISDFEQNR